MGLGSSLPEGCLPVEHSPLAPDVRAHVRMHGGVVNVSHHAPLAVIRYVYDKAGTREVPPEYAGVSSDPPVTIAPGLRIKRYGGARGTAGPAILYFHGGGYTIGSLESHDPTCRLLTAETGFPVYSVEYHLGPEHPVQDPRNSITHSLMAYQWLVEQLGEEGGRKIIITGDSAGGHITIAIGIAVRDHNRRVAAAAATSAGATSGAGATATAGKPAALAMPSVAELGYDAAVLGIGPLAPPLLLAPIYPLTDSSGTVGATALGSDGKPGSGPGSRRKYAWGYLLTQGLIDVFGRCYLGSDVAALGKHYLHSPYWCPDLTGLPRVLLLTAECDMLHDEGVAFHRKLLETAGGASGAAGGAAATASGAAAASAAVVSEHMEGEGQIHGFVNNVVSMPSGKAVMQRFAKRVQAIVRELVGETPAAAAAGKAVAVAAAPAASTA